MNDNFNELIEKFKNINKRGYVKGINNNITNSAGLTFESLLGKKADSMYFPDFQNIEIKTTQRFSRYPITLFTSSFDGPSLFEANYLLNKYGKDDEQFKGKKTLITKLQVNKKILINDKFYFELKIDHIDQTILIEIYDINYNLIEKRGFVNFETLENKMNVKLQNLSVVYASKKKDDKNLYFRYYKIICYKLKNFDAFIKLLKNNKIKVSLCLRVSRSGEQAGKNRNKNLVFSIDKNDVKSLYNQIYIYEN